MGRGGNDAAGATLVPKPPADARPAASGAGRSSVKERGYFTERVGPGRDHASDRQATTGRTAEPPLPEATGGPSSDSYTPRRQVQGAWSAKAPALPATLYEFDAGRYSIDAPASTAVGKSRRSKPFLLAISRPFSRDRL